MTTSSCNIESLAGDLGASISWCPECDSFHLSLGFIQIRLTAEQFNHLYLLINRAMHSVNNRRNQSSGDGKSDAPLRRGLH